VRKLNFSCHLHLLNLFGGFCTKQNPQNKSCILFIFLKKAATRCLLRSGFTMALASTSGIRTLIPLIFGLSRFA